MTTTFDTAHPRVSDGTFTDKPQTAPEVELSAAPTRDRITSDNSFGAAMASGHLKRKGHELVAYFVRAEGAELATLERECC